MNSILDNIDTIRRNKGYSQEYIAAQIGMKQAGFSLIMSGERELKYNTLLQIAKVLQISVIDVITFPEKYIPSKGSSLSTEAVLQIKLDGDKKDQILNIALGEQIADLLKSK
ncbi:MULTISPECIES: helix-turn-helix transcriptional regulator [unclassified Parabacteroides]|jgi:transcriptional regulator with XRE-family HTH domain|uniref:helix-turn-helix domain-containing protein n=1 Tax=unclassified Parabacteroides TaxID=2649774 RepID=UPI000EFFADA2|nr:MULTISPECIES: helix-turn-helix transcriptional regulator [unclassified Parabacteroides]RHO70125.1 XRE family transcriptional regulator [Parabacteroides sp. AF48-14]RHR59509.1 XRE family transcriptional regulator [Parabacteroides sp. AF17-28]